MSTPSKEPNAQGKSWSITRKFVCFSNASYPFRWLLFPLRRRKEKEKENSHGNFFEDFLWKGIQSFLSKSLWKTQKEGKIHEKNYTIIWASEAAAFCCEQWWKMGKFRGWKRKWNGGREKREREERKKKGIRKKRKEKRKEWTEDKDSKTGWNERKKEKTNLNSWLRCVKSHQKWDLKSWRQRSVFFSF